MQATEFFKALSDPTRLRIVKLLGTQSLCVCDIVSQLEQPQPTVSRHLGYLKRLHIVQSERKGTWMWYQLHEDLPTWCQKILTNLP